MNVRNN